MLRLDIIEGRHPAGATEAALDAAFLARPRRSTRRTPVQLGGHHCTCRPTTERGAHRRRVRGGAASELWPAYGAPTLGEG